MPIIKYKCTPCGIGDVKKFLYKYNVDTNSIDLKVCEDCGTPVERTWGRPPQSWYRSIQGGRNE